jgi:acetate kinase
LTAVGHRVVHGGHRITAEMVEELHRLSPFDPEHLPEEILLTEAFHPDFPPCPEWRISTRLFTMTCHAWLGSCRSRAATRRKGCGGMDFTDYRMRF